MDMRLDSRITSRRDLDFLLFDLLNVDAFCERPRFAEHSRATFAAALDTALEIAAEKFAPHNRRSDENEPRFQDGQVQMIPEVKEAVRAFADAGFIAATYDYEQGGMQLPFSVALACVGIFRGANVATDAYGSLTVGAADLIHTFGSEAQKARYLAPMLKGRFLGTMVLTEPQAGSSLADITATATPNDDGTYSLKGSKIFISGGDHELAENIVHLVLARLPDAPRGVKGISLFIVPKHRVNDDGSLGPRNDVALAGLIHKMGFRGTTSTMLSFGEKGSCVAELVGEPNEGLAYMFQMMNGARIGVGLGAAVLGYTGYLHALDYARERRQGRAAKDSAEQVPIIRHADVRRMLLAQKAYAEGALALCLYAGTLLDLEKHGATEVEREDARVLLDLLTPVVKAWPSEYCVTANSLAIQVHGGYGYTRDYAVEQFFRDNRLNAIHEGTNGIQALDLLGRKVFSPGVDSLGLLERELGNTFAQARACGDEEIAAHAEALAHAWQEIVDTTRVIGMQLRREPRLALANASVYLDVFGHAVVAWMWLRQAIAAHAGMAREESDFYRGKLAAARYFFRWELPAAGPKHALLRNLDSTCLDAQEAWF